MTISERRKRKQRILNSIETLICDAPYSKDIEGKIERIVIDANPGLLTVFNSQEALRATHTHIKKHEIIGCLSSRPKISRPRRHRPPKPYQGVFEVVKKFAENPRCGNRIELQQIRSAGQTLTASDGKMYIQVKGNFSGTTKSPIFFDSNTGKEIEQKGKFPKISFNKSEEFPVVKNVCVSDLLTRLYVVRGFLRNIGCDHFFLFKNIDCSLGLYALGNYEGRYKVETIETNLDILSIPADYVNSFSVKRFQFILENLARLSSQNFDVSISDKGFRKTKNIHPLMFRTSKVTIALVPLVFNDHQPMKRPQ